MSRCGTKKASTFRRMDVAYTVKDFGAKGDGLALDHEAIQAAIDLCSAEGGTVYVPTGNYRCGTIRLKSNVNLNLETGAAILGADDPALGPDREQGRSLCHRRCKDAPPGCPKSF